MDKILLHPREAAEMIGFKLATFYDLMKTNRGLRECVVEIPGVRGKRIHAVRFQGWIDSIEALKRA
jgi:predicted DNA-binding transcriptional regulator AlpA